MSATGTDRVFFTSFFFEKLFMSAQTFLDFQKQRIKVNFQLEQVVAVRDCKIDYRHGQHSD
jgi:aminopeptidase C